MDGDAEGMAESAVRAAREVRVAYSRLRRRFRDVGAVAGVAGLTPSQTSVLSRLSKEGERTASALAAAEKVRPQSMAATLGVLEERGLIERRRDPDDGRRQVVTLTVAGMDHVTGSRKAREEWLAREFQERFTEDERATVIAAMGLLDRLS